MEPRKEISPGLGISGFNIAQIPIANIIRGCYNSYKYYKYSTVKTCMAGGYLWTERRL